MLAKVRKAVFPAAGLGTRFLPATKAQPKEMLPLVDKPLIQYGVEEAIHSGIQNMIIVTGRLVVVHEAPSNVGLGAEIAARVTEECFYSMEAPVLRVAGFDTPYPAARLEEEYLPDLDRVLDAVDRSFGW